jgi:hypothetical protein
LSTNIPVGFSNSSLKYDQVLGMELMRSKLEEEETLQEENKTTISILE